MQFVHYFILLPYSKSDLQLYLLSEISFCRSTNTNNKINQNDYTFRSSYRYT